jgi:hypothetical protein
VFSPMLNFDLALCGNRAAPYTISKSALPTPGNANLCKPLPARLLAMCRGRNLRGKLPTHFSGRSALGNPPNAPNGNRRVQQQWVDSNSVERESEKSKWQVEQGVLYAKRAMATWQRSVCGMGWPWWIASEAESADGQSLLRY